MPKIILLIENDDDKLRPAANIVCYMVADTLSAAKINDVRQTGGMVLAFGGKALEICRRYDLDGIVAEPDTSKPLKKQLKPLREALNKKTLGVIIPARRHEAMLAGEIEPEFIAFRAEGSPHDKDIVSWYNDLFLIPSAWIVPDGGAPDDIPDVDFAIVRAKNFENFGC